MADSMIPPSMMMALIKETPEKGFLLKKMPIPTPGKDDLIIRITYASLCGSDINLYNWNDIAKSVASVPFIPGHEAVGVVVGRGAEVDTSFTFGCRVAVENHYYCGTCYQCTHDEKHICQNMHQYGHGNGTQQGGCSEYSLVPAKYAYKLENDSVSNEQACLLEPTGVAHHAIEDIQPEGEITLVIGCGPIGLLACTFAKLFGAVKVIATDVQEERLARAKEMGADHTVNGSSEEFNDVIKKLTDGNGVGVVVEASGASSMVTKAFELLRKGGKIVVIGLPKSDITIENPLKNFLTKNVTVKTVYGRKVFHTWKESERLVAEEKVKSQLLVSHIIPLSEYQKAYDLLCSGKAMKILLDPSK